MVIAGNVTDSWTACLRSFCAAIRISAALLRSAAESMVGFLGGTAMEHDPLPAIKPLPRFVGTR